MEFHIEFDRETDLGPPGSHWGWQCKWYDLPVTRSLGVNRRTDITDSLEKAILHVAGLTDWVLWLHQLPRKADVDWFLGLKSSVRLHLWAADRVEDLTVGEGAVVRSAYFGELVLTPAMLAEAHETAIAPVRKRWDPAVHVAVKGEMLLRRILAEPHTRQELHDHASILSDRAAALVPTGIDGSVDAEIGRLAAAYASAGDRLQRIATLIDSGEPYKARLTADEAVNWHAPSAETRRAARRLRAMRHPSALVVGASNWDLARASQLLDEARRDLGMSLCAVLGDAGRGKTYLGVELTRQTAGKPAGAFIMCRDLGNRDSLDELTTRIRPASIRTFDDLLEALEAAGARSGSRLAIVLDGLNESEEPRDWSAHLARLGTSLRNKPHVVAIATLRSSVRQVVPTGTPMLTLRGFTSEVEEAASKYFAYYNIDPGDADLPFDRFDNPLFLRIFCEATNPDRSKRVTPDAIPGSLTAAFAAYRDVAVARVAEDLGLADSDVNSALDRVAVHLWNAGTRWLPFDELRTIAGDAPRAWKDSVARALEEEGVLSRDPGPGGDQRSAILFDAFAGHLIADAHITRLGSGGFERWLQSRRTRGQLESPPIELRTNVSVLDHIVERRVIPFAEAVRARISGREHPLAEDVLVALAGLTPRRLHHQVWPLLDKNLRRKSLLASADLEGALIDGRTANELQALVASSRYPKLLRRIHAARHSPHHPLNAQFLDGALRQMAVADRDLYWTEWLRRERDTVERDIAAFSAAVERGDDSDVLALHATWAGWALTSTIRNLRDAATRALVVFGEAHPEALFRLALSCATLNDPYVPERVFGACYGTAMRRQQPSAQFQGVFSSFLDSLTETIAGDHPEALTSHWLTREYVAGIFSLGHMAGLIGSLPTLSAPSGPPRSLGPSQAEETDLAIHMDFENYTIGRLIDGRHNYDMQEPRFVAVLGEVRSRIWDLGWRQDRFGSIDRTIGEYRYRENREGRDDRYGKKYGWIGFYEAAARLASRGELPGDGPGDRISDVDIDPSFPQPPPQLDLALEPWAASSMSDDKTWLSSAPIAVPNDLIHPASVNGHIGPWVAAEGYLKQEDEATGRNVFGFVRTMLIDAGDVAPVTSEARSRKYLGNWWIPEPPGDYYAFAGEFPWLAGLLSAPDLYEVEVEAAGTVVRAELLAHDYRWERHHSDLNQAGGNPMPSVKFSRRNGLSWTPPSFDHLDGEGRPGSLTVGAPSGFAGSILYLREDLLRSYAGGRNLVWCVWGERQLGIRSYETRPRWLERALERSDVVWRSVETMAL